MRTASRVTTRILSGFDDPSFGAGEWAGLLERGPTNTFDLTCQVQRAWWEACGHGRLLLVVASCGGEDVALAPFFTSGGMVFNLASKDRLDFVGDVSDPVVLDTLLTTARDEAEGFAGFQLYFIADSSPTAARLQSSAERLGLSCHDEGSIASPVMPVRGDPEHADACTRKKSLRRHENALRREGEVTVTHLTDGGAISAQLDEFFAQHVARRSVTEAASLFEDEASRSFYRRMTELAADTGWIRFTRIDWNGSAIAFHYGSSYQGRYLYGIPSFDPAVAKWSPGEVLLRQLFLGAIDEGVDSFDFGIGDEAYKYRFATHEASLRTWGLYP